MLELIKVKYDQDIKKQLEKRFIAFDVETTGLSAVHNDLIQIAASKMHKGNIVEQFDEVDSNEVFNAFIMPFDCESGERLKFVSVGKADWENYGNDSPNYAYVLGILLDTKYLITEYVRHNELQIENLADTIESSLEDFRKLIE